MRNADFGMRNENCRSWLGVRSWGMGEINVKRGDLISFHPLSPRAAQAHRQEVFPLELRLPGC